MIPQLVQHLLHLEGCRDCLQESRCPAQAKQAINRTTGGWGGESGLRRGGGKLGESVPDYLRTCRGRNRDPSSDRQVELFRKLLRLDVSSGRQVELLHKPLGLDAWELG